MTAATLCYLAAGLCGSLLISRYCKSSMTFFALAMGMLLGTAVSSGVKDGILNKAAIAQVLNSETSTSSLPVSIALCNNTAEDMMMGQMNQSVQYLAPSTNWYSAILPFVGGTQPSDTWPQDSS